VGNTDNELEGDPEATLQESGPPADAARQILAPAAVSIVVLSGAQRGRTIAVPARLRVGRGADNDLALDDATVSRRHCEISRVPGGIRVRDLGSDNGTYVESARVTDAIASMGSILSIGAVKLALRPDLEVLEVEPLPQTEFEGAIGRSLEMRRIFRVLDGVARTEATVLLEGETGTGKEVLARAIARRSHRPEPFVVVDCGAVTPALIQSELFGHERGAFTGAVAQRKGAFELAHGGTIFLDEIGELSVDVQPTLLRVLESREFRRVGGNQSLKVDARVIAATSRDLLREVGAGKFREDLYFRLAVVPMRIPPLRTRREDIPALVEHILSRLPSARALTPSPQTMTWLLQHDWPGNVRELRNVLERGAYISSAAGSAELRLSELPAGGGDGGDVASLLRFSPAEAYRDARKRIEEEFERRYVTWLLACHGGNLSAAARAARMDRKHLHVLARKHGLRGELESDG
jgi:DNA-binding NtrC family response regulator